MTWREDFIKRLMKSRKIGRARAEAIYAAREHRFDDFQYRIVSHIDISDLDDDDDEQ